MTDSPLPEPVDPGVLAFKAWLRGLSLYELEQYRVGLVDGITGDDEGFATWAAALLPVVDAAVIETELREDLRLALAEDMPSVDFDVLWPALTAINRGRRQLGLSNDASEVFDAALEILERNPECQ